MPAVEVTVDTHRTSNVAGKNVTEYSVCAKTVRSAQEDQAADRCLSWHRYTDFKVLHDQVRDALGLDRWFPCPKALIFTDAQKQERAGELHAYLQGCVLPPGRAAASAARVPLHPDEGLDEQAVAVDRGRVALRHRLALFAASRQRDRGRDRH